MNKTREQLAIEYMDIMDILPTSEDATEAREYFHNLLGMESWEFESLKSRFKGLKELEATLQEANQYCVSNLDHIMMIEGIESIIERTKNTLLGDLDSYYWEDLEHLEQEKELDLLNEINDYIKKY